MQEYFRVSSDFNEKYGIIRFFEKLSKKEYTKPSPFYFNFSKKSIVS